MQVIPIDFYYRIDWQGQEPVRMDDPAFWDDNESMLVYRTRERLPGMTETREALMAFDFEQELIWRQLPDGTTEYCEKMQAYRHWRPHYDEYMKRYKKFKRLKYINSGMAKK